jgi:methionyl-tRNA formyltransferase
MEFSSNNIQALSEKVISGNLDYLIAIKWHHLIPEELVANVKQLIVFHASLLPKHRGFAPVNWPIILGEKQSGVTMFFAAAEVDAGDIIDQVEFEITEADDAGTVDARVSHIVPEMLVKNLQLIDQGKVTATPQDHSKATYCSWRGPEDGQIDWSMPAKKIRNLIRGLTHPYPGAFTYYEGKKLYCWQAELRQDRLYRGFVPGKIDRIVKNTGVSVICGDGKTIFLTMVQLAGDEERNPSEFIKKIKIKFE